MSASSKFDLSSGSPDRPTFPSGQRGVYTAASLDRSGSFREGMENRIQSSRPNMSRSGSALSQGDVTNFFHSLPLDNKLMAAGHKLPRQVEVNRMITASLGISPDDSLSGSSTTKLLPASLEGIKRVKDSIHDGVTRASDQTKIWAEAISKFDKHFPSVWTRKRSRSDVQPSSRSNTSLAGDRLVLGNPAKLSTQSNVTSSGFDHEQQKLEEQMKNAAPNKRIRTSMVDVQMDVRGNALGRPPGAMDRDKEMFGIANGGSVQSEEKDQALPIGIDGWEKSKMRKKRSGIKSDVSINGVSIRSPDGDRECKREIQQRLGIDARSRLSNVHGFRSGPSSGTVGIGKLDINCQQTGLSMRSTPRTDQDNSSLLNDRRDCFAGADKEKLNLKAINKLNIRESHSSASPASTTKMSPSTRAPRSGSGTISKSSPNVHRAIGVPDDWDIPQNTNKLHAVVGANNRKRTPSTHSSPPPVAQWGGQRPQKISRVARRTNFVPLLSGHDEPLTTDKISDISVNETGIGLRQSSGNSLQQVRLKGDQLSSVALSESEESGAAEIRSKDKGKKSGELDEKTGQNVQKVATSVSSSRKNKMQDEDLGVGDTVRRQGRTARGLTSARSSISMAVEKLDYTAKQLRSARLGCVKLGSKVGRPPTRKLSERKAYTRPRHPVNSGAPDLLGESHDVHEELLAAANAAVNSGHSSSFWRQMEPLFSVVSAEDIAYLKQQGNLGFNLLTPTPGAFCRDDCSTVPKRFELVDNKRDMGLASEVRRLEHFPEQLGPRRRAHNVIPLCQRLIAALVSEEENEGFCYRGDDDLKFDVNGIRFELDAELRPHILNHCSMGNLHTNGKPVSNGYGIPATRRYHNGLVHDELDFPAVPNAGIISSFGHSLNGLQADQEVMPNMPCSEFQYNQMSLDERLLLEIQSIGIFPEPVPDLAQREDEDINEDVSRLEEKLTQQVTKKKHLLCKVEKSAMEARELQEREIERSAYEKLVGLAYDKYMACCGPNASCGKGASSKIAKQGALALVKRTLERCQKFEDFGESCFNEPVFQDLFRSVSSHLKVSECVDSIIEGESANLYANTPTHSSEVRVSAPIGTHHIPSLISQSGQNMDTRDKYYSDGFQSVNQLSEEIIGKEDKGLTKVKKRELLLDDVVGGTVGTSSRAPSGIGSSLSSGAKGKRSERDREGKGHNRELSRNSTVKIGRPALGNVKGERKPKSKPKQKTTQLSASVNGLLGKAPEPPKAVSASASRSSGITTDINAKKKNDLSLGTSNDSEALDLSHLPLPGIDELGVPDDLDGQGQDLGSWLNIDDDALQDIDFMGLEIPMDDLSDLKMMV
ncbi:hypothetical protein BVC80_209g129 [Macleaya cordata]|uniref:Uncharacterized protein n=1 Tax=Macleaya cordata TaxID=56857 RepID=A0A200QDD8_MACCD|nr:hypothetical protein BVC80_209g129 [Macleaya cordata]